MDAAKTDGGTVTVRFTYAEAVVLSDFLSRSEAPPGIPTEHPAEVRLLNDLTASLEPMIDEAFSPDYSTVVAEAREVVTRAG